MRDGPVRTVLDARQKSGSPEVNSGLPDFRKPKTRQQIVDPLPGFFQLKDYLDETDLYQSLTSFVICSPPFAFQLATNSSKAVMGSLP